MYRRVSYLLLVFALFILFAMDSNSTTTDEAIIIAQNEPPSYTIEELAQYNGEDEQPAYVVIDEVVYDISDVEEWEENLQEDFLAGQDISKIIKADSIKDIILEQAPEVGILQSE